MRKIDCLHLTNDFVFVCGELVCGICYADKLEERLILAPKHANQPVPEWEHKKIMKARGHGKLSKH